MCLESSLSSDQEPAQQRDGRWLTFTLRRVATAAAGWQSSGGAQQRQLSIQSARNFGIPFEKKMSQIHTHTHCIVDYTFEQGHFVVRTTCSSRRQTANGWIHRESFGPLREAQTTM